VKSCRRVLTFLAVMALNQLALAQLDTNWLRQFDGGQADEDWLSDMFVDSAGYVYVTGTAVVNNLWDIVVQKYTPNGVRLWSASYDGTAHNDDSAAALTVDPTGNVYVCGWVTDTASGMDMVTLKYSPTGSLLWAKTFHQPGNGDDAALALCLDAAGHVVVTGYCSDSTLYNIDYCTIKYAAATGDTIWVRFYNRTPENDEDVSVAVCSDESSYIYLTGYSYDDGTDYDIATICYRPDGSRRWLRRFNNRPWVGDDYGTKVVYDRVTRSVILGGTVYDDNQDYNYFTMKYRRTGESLWARTYNRYPADDDDWLTAVCLGPRSTVTVTGMSYDNSTWFDIATVCYDSNGIQRWVARQDLEGRDDAGVDLVIDSLGQTLVTGYLESSANDLDLAVIKYDTAGGAQWHWHWDHTSHNEDQGTKIAVRPDGTSYVAGTCFDNLTDYDFVVLKCHELGHDLGIPDLFVPDSLWITDSLIPRAVVGNFGTNRDSGWVRLRINTTGYQESLWVNLRPGYDETLTFSPWHPDTAGLYQVVCWTSLLNDERSWNDTARAPVVVWDETVAVSEERLARKGFGLQVFPNPVRGQAVIRLWLNPAQSQSAGPRAQPVSLKMFDVTGSLVWCCSVADRSDIRLDGSLLAPGVYFLKLRQGARETGRKLVIQH